MSGTFKTGEEVVIQITLSSQTSMLSSEFKVLVQTILAEETFLLSSESTNLRFKVIFRGLNNQNVIFI